MVSKLHSLAMPLAAPLHECNMQSHFSLAPLRANHLFTEVKNTLRVHTADICLELLLV